MLRKLFGGVAANEQGALSVDEARAQLDAGGALLVDVREADEWRAGHVAGARHIPLSSLPDHLAALPRDRDILLFCRSGNRSGMATKLLRQHGFERAKNVNGGVTAWQQRGLPLVQGS